MSSFQLVFFDDPPTTQTYSLSLHDALPICLSRSYQMETSVPTKPSNSDITDQRDPQMEIAAPEIAARNEYALDRKSTRLNSSHGYISYAVFCLKKKKEKKEITTSKQFKK